MGNAPSVNVEYNPQTGEVTEVTQQAPPPPAGCNNNGWQNPQACMGMDNPYISPWPDSIRQPNVCGFKPGPKTGDNATFNSGFSYGAWNNDNGGNSVESYCKSVFGPNYGVYREFPWGNGGPGGSWGYCRMQGPTEANKYDCCTKDPSQLTTDQCGVFWCQSNVNTCKPWMTNTFCKQGTNALTNDACFNNYKDENAIATLCSQQEHFRNPRCKTFCDAQVGANNSFAAGCKTAAGTYCAANPSAAECTCISYQNTPDYKELIAKYSLLSTVSSQCWADVCVNNPAPSWSENLTTVPATGAGACPAQLSLCNQTIDLAGAKISTVGSLEQKCETKQVQSSSVGAPAPGTTTPAPGSPVVTVPGSPPVVPTPGSPPVVTESFFSRNKYFIGGGGVLLSLLCCLLLILLILFS